MAGAPLQDFLSGGLLFESQAVGEACQEGEASEVPTSPSRRFTSLSQMACERTSAALPMACSRHLKSSREMLCRGSRATRVLDS